MKGLLLIPISLAATMMTAPVDAPAHRAKVTGAVTATLAGQAVFGPVVGAEACVGASCSASFSLELGAYSDSGAVVFSRVSSERPRVGTYKVEPLTDGAEDAGEFHALVSLGSAAAPTGAFRAVRGTVTITQSSADRIVGQYEVEAVGFLAADMDNEDRRITVRGGFTAVPARPSAMFEATLHGAVEGSPRGGGAEFGAVGSGNEGIFSLSLGTYSEQGAIVLSRSGTERPQAGVYPVRASQAGFHGLVITGSPSAPTGVFRIERGNLTVTGSSPERLTGSFELHAVGFLADTPDREDREVLVSGTFSATARGAVVTTLTVR